MEDWKVQNVAFNLHLTPEAAEILRDYASERNRGKFISALLVAQRERDDLEAKGKRQARRDQKAVEARQKFTLGGSPKKGKRVRGH